MHPAKSCSILLVDDSPTVLGMLSDTLKARRYRVRTAENGREALESIAQCPPDLVLIDVMMPEMDGYEVCEILRRQEGTGAYIPVLMLTASGDVARGLAAGADDFIAKPPDHNELIARVENLVRLGDLKKTLHEKNRELENKNFLLHAQNQQLEAMAGQLQAQNQQLEAMAGQLQAQNQQLETIASELQAANQHLAHLSVTDGLTGAHNHRHFQERLREELARASRHGTPVSCVLLDIDWFKQVNDSYGHLLGDRVLVSLVEILRQSLRKEDVVCRYGGEEFAVLLPAITPDKARVLADRLRETVAATCFPLPGGGSLSITVSAGVVGYSSGEWVPGPLAFVGAADQALMRAKQFGRNRVEQDVLVDRRGNLNIGPEHERPLVQP